MSKLPRIREAIINPGDVVLVRIDCNVPLDDKGHITDAFRLEAVAETLEFLKSKQAKIVIAGAIGRPKGKRDESLTTYPIAKYFGENLFDSCEYVSSAIGDAAQDEIMELENSHAIVLENLRFYEGEETNDVDFAKSLSQGIDIYVNDAFGQCHRKQASIVEITNYLPSFAGCCLEKEIKALDSVLGKGEKPIVAIVGGAKVSDKLGVIEALIEKCDAILIGGAMAFTFLKSRGAEIGNSLCEDSFLEKASVLLKTGKIVLPTDFIVADSIDSKDTQTVSIIEPGLSGFDIGPESVGAFAELIATAKTILWNGPMGVFEKEQFAEGTKSIGELVAKSNAFSVIGGGDSVAAIRALGLENEIDHVSTGGGATLEYIESGTLVGVEALIKKEEK